MKLCEERLPRLATERAGTGSTRSNAVSIRRMSVSCRFSLTVLFALSLLSSPVFGADSPTSHPPANPKVRAILADLGKVENVGQTSLSPDGARLAWTERGHGSGSRIMVSDAHGLGASPLETDADCTVSDPLWSPDSRALLFEGECGGSGQTDLFVTTLHGKPEQITHLKGFLEHPAWSPDGRRVAFLYVPGATRPAGALAAMKLPSGVIGVEGLEVQRIAAVDAQGGEIQLLTPEKLHVYEFDWSPDSGKVAYVAAPPPGENNWWVAQLYTASATADAQPTSIVNPQTASGSLHGLQIAVPRWSPDGARISFIGGLMSDQGSTGGDVYLVPAAGGKPVNLTPNAEVTAVWPHWTGNDTLVVSEIAGGTSRIAGYHLVTSDTPSLTNEQTLLEIPAGIGDGRESMSLSVAKNGAFAVASSSFEKPPEIYVGELKPGSQLSQVTHVNDSLKAAWGKTESIEWTNEGFRIQGWLMLPAHYDPAKKYPLIVMVHGGPSAAVLPRWPYAGFSGAPLSAMDYFVLEPNPRGSFGQGETFTMANRKDFGYGDLRDILTGIDAVEKKYPGVDDSRLGLTGWSYGGFMTMFGVTQTGRFHAAVAGAGIANWQSYYGENSIDQWMLPFFGASVYDDPAVYAKSSAIDFIRKVKTPTLVVVGDRDGECPAPQSFEFWHALRDEGVPTELVVYPNEGHGFRNPEHRIDVLERTLNWFDQYLGATPNAAAGQ
jgi:dipeptidyl aminopeptidase/acylaminoacyl peptidase